ncbi:hypothetical protein [Nitrococcus mobilis]|uniref:Uncharacterized protein n=1 Tax=Nitrococcus mobilis Nb-231 TaxID=314278 RepID=A4BVE2_9GAMM|nr:hypothetical protein [Nitrococcus mobilis]EAR20327.1 hypothetical protein NB231_03005 [Nitrococcus mobilis Nb-231]
MKPVAVLIARILAVAMADRAVRIASIGQPVVDAILVGVDLVPGSMAARSSGAIVAC